MRTKIFLFLTVFFTVSQFAQQQGKYIFMKSGHIEYQLNGNTTGTKSVWFDEYGMLMYTLTNSTQKTNWKFAKVISCGKLIC